MRNKKAFTLLETLIALSILLVLLPLINNFFYSNVKKYVKFSEENRELSQIIFVESYLKKISRNSDSISQVGNVLHIDVGGIVHEVGVKNKKLYTMQVATRYLTVEPMLVVSHRFIKVNDNYYQIEIQTQANKDYLIPVVRY